MQSGTVRNTVSLDMPWLYYLNGKILDIPILQKIRKLSEVL